jgi:putative transposase
VKKRYSYEITPGLAARQSLARTFGSARVVFNDFVAQNRAHYAAGEKYTSYYGAATTLITVAKTTPERSWLSEVSTDALQQSLRDAHQGYQNFFNSVAGKRKGKRVSAPKFKSRHDSRQSVRFSVNGFILRGGWRNSNPNGGRLYLAKIGDIPVRWSRPLPGNPTSITITRTPDGRYHASFVVDHAATPTVDPVYPGRAAGIDMGLTHFASIAYSDGTRERITNPRYFDASHRRLARAQKSLARKSKGSSNRAKQKLKVARIHQHIANQRSDHANQLVSKLIRENQTVAVETLGISGLARTRLAKSIHDAGWGSFLTKLQVKAIDSGRKFFAAARSFPSSQICSICDVKDGPKPLNIREWECQQCHTRLDRDYNSCTNLTVAAGQAQPPLSGLMETLNACGGQIRRLMASAEVAPPEETGTNPNSTITDG